MRWSLWCVLILVPPAAGGCQIADFYAGEERYVLYDDTIPAAEATVDTGPSGADEATAKRDPLAADVSPAAAAPAILDANLRRVFQLEAMIDELERARAEGAAERDRLLLKVDAFKRELQWRKARAGERYAVARDLRLDHLLSLTAAPAPDATPAAEESAGDSAAESDGDTQP